MRSGRAIELARGSALGGWRSIPAFARLDRWRCAEWLYTRSVKIFAFLSLGLGLAFAQRDGSFDIRFEPTAILQTGVQIPFSIKVADARHKPVHAAKVTLQINTKDPTETKVLPATETDPGTYIAKPVFPHSGQWDVYVEVEHDGARTARTKEVLVP